MSKRHARARRADNRRARDMAHRARPEVRKVLTGRSPEARFFRYVAAHPDWFSRQPMNEKVEVYRKRAAEGIPVKVEGGSRTLYGGDCFAFLLGRHRLADWHDKRFNRPAAKQLLEKLGATTRKNRPLERMVMHPQYTALNLLALAFESSEQRSRLHSNPYGPEVHCTLLEKSGRVVFQFDYPKEVTEKMMDAYRGFAHSNEIWRQFTELEGQQLVFVLRLTPGEFGLLRQTCRHFLEGTRTRFVSERFTAAEFEKIMALGNR